MFSQVPVCPQGRLPTGRRKFALMQADPPTTGKADPKGMADPRPIWMLQDTVNKRAVRILMECIFVNRRISAASPRMQMQLPLKSTGTFQCGK